MQAFTQAQTAGRTVRLGTGGEIAEGNLYNLSQNSQLQTLSVVDKVDERLVAQFDSQGLAVSSQPSFKDRQQWQEIAAQLQLQSQPAMKPAQDKEIGEY
jgi:hypothetical protein